MSVEGADRDCLGDASGEGGHTSGEGTSAGWENISDSNVLDESGVNGSLLPYGTENGGQILLRPRVFETPLHALGDRRANSGDDDDVIVVLAQNLGFSAL